MSISCLTKPRQFELSFKLRVCIYTYIHIYIYIYIHVPRDRVVATNSASEVGSHRCLVSAGTRDARSGVLSMGLTRVNRVGSSWVSIPCYANLLTGASRVGHDENNFARSVRFSPVSLSLSLSLSLSRSVSFSQLAARRPAVVENHRARVPTFGHSFWKIISFLRTALRLSGNETSPLAFVFLRRGPPRSREIRRTIRLRWRETAAARAREQEGGEE